MARALEAAPLPPPRLNGNGSGAKVEEVAEPPEVVEAAPEQETALDVEPAPVAEEPKRAPAAAETAAIRPANGKAATGSGNGAQEKSNGTGGRVQVSVTLHETADEEADMDRFNRVVDVLKRHPGHDRVQLLIIQQGEPMTVTMPFETTHSETLESEITEIMGGSYLSVQPLLI